MSSSMAETGVRIENSSRTMGCISPRIATGVPLTRHTAALPGINAPNVGSASLSGSYVAGKSPIAVRSASSTCRMRV